MQVNKFIARRQANNIRRVIGGRYSVSTPQHEKFMPLADVRRLMEAENPLVDIIRKEISEKGPMSYNRYFEMALTHPQYGEVTRLLHEPERF